METKGFRFEPTVEPVTRKKYQIKIFGIGTTGLHVVDHLYKMGTKDTRFIVCHADLHPLMASPVPTKLLYDVDPNSEAEELDFMLQLAFTLKSSELTIIVTDLRNQTDCHLAMSAARILAEQGEFSICILALSDIENPLFNEVKNKVLADLQHLASTLLIYEQVETPFEERIWQLGAAVLRIIQLCDEFTDEDFDALRTVIKSPGRIAIASGRGVGDGRTDAAVGEIIQQINTQSFATTYTQGMMVITSSSNWQPLLVREQTEIMNNIMAYVDTDPTIVKLALIQDCRLREAIVVNVLLWAPINAE